jgi:hypothetical protein
MRCAKADQVGSGSFNQRCASGDVGGMSAAMLVALRTTGAGVPRVGA